MVAGLVQAVFLFGAVGFYSKEVFKMISSYYSEQFQEQVIAKIEENIRNSSDEAAEQFCRSSGFLELVGVSF